MRSQGHIRAFFVAALLGAALVLGSGGAGAADDVDSTPPDGLSPSTLSLTLGAGASETTATQLHLNASPPRADVILAVDTTGSMGAAIADARADAVAIVNAVKLSIPDARFAVVDFKDYDDPPFGFPNDESAPEYPYLLRQPLTIDPAAVKRAVDAMSASGGGDDAESYNRVVFESYSDGALGRDANAPGFLVFLGDQLPHDAGQSAVFSSCPDQPPTDPGRDAVPGNADDLTTKDVLDGAKQHHLNVSYVAYNPAAAVTSCWSQLTSYTGGQRATRDQASGLAAQIVELIREDAARVDEVTFRTTPASFASWLSTTPPAPYGPLTAPADIAFEETITVPAGTAPGTYAFTVDAVADGAVRASQSVTVVVRQQIVSSLALTVDERSAPAGVALAPFSSIPASRIPFLGASTSALPAGSIPAGSIPAGSIPAGSIPAGSIPAGSIPAGSIPAGSIPAGSIGLGTAPAGSIPAGSIALSHVLLSQIPLRAPATWDDITVGTSLAKRPLQTLTFQDLADNPVALGRFNALSLEKIDFGSSLWRGAPFAALLLGNATLAQLPSPPGFSSWTAALDANGGSSAGVDPNANTVFGVYVGGQLGSTPAGSIPAGSINFGSLPAGSIPAGSIPAGSINIAMTRLAGVALADFGAALNTLVTCDSQFSCAGKTLGDAYTAGKIKPTTTLAAVFQALPAGHAALATTIDQIIAAMLPLGSYPWELIAVDGLQDVAGTGQDLHYHADFDLHCAIAGAASPLTVKLRLPAGFLPKRGTTTFSYAGAAAVPGAEPTGDERAGYSFTPPAGACPTGSTSTRHVRMNVTVFAGLELGDHTSRASVVSALGTYSTPASAPVQITQNHESNDDGLTAPVIARNTLVVGHVAAADDRESFRLPLDGIPRNSKIIAFLKVPGDADLDLVVHKPFAPSLQSTPAGSIPAGSIPVEDRGVSVDNSRTPLPPETVADVPAGSIPAGSIPAGSIPAGSISANRGTANEAAQIVTAGEQGHAIVTVSGYNGAHSDKPFVLRLQVVDPPPLPPCPPVTGLDVATPGTLPAPGSLDAATKTLFLVNRQRLVGLYGATAVNDLLGITSPLATVAARPEVKGAVIPVDGSADVRAAYAAWDANRCSVDAANQVVRKINDVVASYRAALPQLRNLVLLGIDDALPMYRQADLVTLSPEIDEAADLAFTTKGLTEGNALYASAAQNTVLTDGAYGAFTKQTWLGHDLPLAQTPVARLVETPAAIEGQFQQYLDANGLLDPLTELTTGYDFLVDGSNEINAALLGQFSGIAPATLIDDLWQRADIDSAFFDMTDVPDIVSPNAHYSHWLLQPAAPNPITSSSQLATSADVPAAAAIAGSLLFTMGCHGGLNVSNQLPAAAADAERLDDWVQRYLQARTAVYVANTGFAYGDLETAALTERLLRLFAQRLNSANTTVGEQWIDALQTYYLSAGDYDVFDEKVMIEATFYGLPFYRFASPGSTPATSPPSTAPEGNVEVASLAPITPALTQHTRADGSRWWESGGETLNVPYRPVQPNLSRDVTVPGKSARGVWIRSLQTHDVAGVKPVLAYPRVDLAAHEPEPDFAPIFWPATPVKLLRTKSLGVERASVVVTAGQFRPTTPGSPTGTQRLVDGIGLDVVYTSPAVTDTSPPEIRQVGGVIHGGGTTFFVRTADAAGTVQRVAVLYNTGAPAWTYKELSPAGGDLWKAHVAGLTTPVQVLAQARDSAGAVGFGANKAVNYISAPDSAGPDLHVDSPLAGAVFTLNQRVEPDFACSDAGAVADCTGSVLVAGLLDTRTVGPHTFTVTGTDLAGNSAPKAVPYRVQYAFTGFKPPVDNPPMLNLAKAGSTVPLKWTIRDAAGVSIGDLGTVVSVSSTTIACPNASQSVVEETVTPSLLPLRYDALAEQFVYTWKTEASWQNTCRRVFVALTDDTVHAADFQFK